MANNRWYTKGLQWARKHYIFTFTIKFEYKSIDFENLQYLRDNIFYCEVLTVSKGKEWNGWHKALICWNTQLSSSKNIFQKLLCILVTFRFEVIKILVLKLRRISVHLFNLRLQLDSQLDYRWVKRVDPLSPVRFNLNGGNLHFL